MSVEEFDVGPISGQPVYEIESDDLDVASISAQPIYEEDPLRSRQEWTRLVIVGSLLLLFGVLLVASLIATIDDKRWANTEKLLGVLLAPVAGLLGTALGFYFRTEKS